jgi:hypothetical protein
MDQLFKWKIEVGFYRESKTYSDYKPGQVMSNYHMVVIFSSVGDKVLE